MPNRVTRESNTRTDDLLRDLRTELGPQSKITIVSEKGNVKLTASGKNGRVTEQAKTQTVAIERAVKKMQNGSAPKRTRVAKRAPAKTASRRRTRATAAE